MKDRPDNQALPESKPHDQAADSALPPSSCGRHRGVWFMALALGVAVLASYQAPRWLAAAGAWLDVGEPPRRCDYVLTLPGDEETRPFVSAALLKTGLADRALVFQGRITPSVADGLSDPSDVIITRVLTLRGVQADRIERLARTSLSTFDDARYVRQFLEEHPHVVLAIVTNDYHSRRARWVFQRVLGSLAARTHFVTAPVDGIAPGNWWRRKSGCKRYVSEYVKLAAYLCLYGQGGYWLAALTGGLALAFCGRAYCQRRRRPKPNAT